MPAVLRIEIRPTDDGRPGRRNAGSSGLWRSLVARFVWDEDVAGSNPVSPTTVSSTIVSSTDEQEPGLRSAEPVQF
jgi:hypothetical protein